MSWISPGTTVRPGEIGNNGRLPFVGKFRFKISVKWYWYFLGTENGNEIELYHLQNTSKFFAFSRLEAWHW